MIAVLRNSVDRLGTAGVVGIGLLVFAAAFYWSAVLPTEAKIKTLRVTAATLQEKLKSSGSIARDTKVVGSDQLTAFYAFFPRSDTTPDWLARINEAARASNVTLQSGEYKLERRSEQKLARYQITLPMTGTYGQMREFIGNVLSQVPAASLDEVTLRRENVTSQRIEARVRFTLYLSSGGAS
jgi:Tfp pilus assembly protein PilO